MLYYTSELAAAFKKPWEKVVFEAFGDHIKRLLKDLDDLGKKGGAKEPKEKGDDKKDPKDKKKDNKEKQKDKQKAKKQKKLFRFHFNKRRPLVLATWFLIVLFHDEVALVTTGRPLWSAVAALQ